MTRKKSEIKDRVQKNVPKIYEEFPYAFWAVVIGSVAGWELFKFFGKILF